MTLVGFIRHGRTDWNEQKRIQGRTDRPLSNRGRKEMAARRPPAELAGAHWFVSPLRRTRETAELLGIGSCTVEPRLIEMSFGAWEGRTLEDLRAEHQTDMAENELRGLDFRAPGGESPRDVCARLQRWLEERGAAGEATGAVTHNGVIRAALSLAHDWDMTGPPPVKPDWACAHLFQLHNDRRLQPIRLNLPLPRGTS